MGIVNDGGGCECGCTEVAGAKDEFRSNEATGEESVGNIDQDENCSRIYVGNDKEEKSYDGVIHEGDRGSENSTDLEHSRQNSNTENEGANVLGGNESDTGLLDDEDSAYKNQSSSGSGKPNANVGRHGGNKSNQNYGWGSGGEYGNGYGPGHGEDDGDSSDGSISENGDRNNRIPVVEAMYMLGINAEMEVNERDLVLDVHPD